MLKMIAAVGLNNELGKDGDLCFRLKEDMKFFRKTTMGSSVVMGYKTWLSLPGALPGRKNYVFSRSPVELPDGVEQVSDMGAFVKKWKICDETCFVIGGGSIYKQLIDECDEIYLTEIDAKCDGADTFFPDFDKANYDKIELGNGVCDGIKYTFVKYIKH